MFDMANLTYILVLLLGDVGCKLDEEAPFTAEIDDYLGELKEVIRDQGLAFPYNSGMWLVSNLVAAISPDGLDRVDQHLPVSRFTMQQLLGRTLSEQEYVLYFQHHPQAAQYQGVLERLLHEPTPASSIIPSEEGSERKCAIM